jgi:N-acetyl sugar amidotransferase
MKNLHRICSRCIMDTTDTKIKFDSNGLCEYCVNFDNNIKPNWHNSNSQKNTEILNQLSNIIRAEGKNKDFDCIIGLSGGLDSSYAAYIAKEKLNLRPLLVHVDAGWNREQAAGNIEKLVDGLDVDLYTKVANWDEVKRMHVAFLRSGIPDQDLIQDAVVISELYKFARKYNVKYVITGSNFSNECCREPEEWGGYLGIDKSLFKNIWQLHGDGKPNNFSQGLIDTLVIKLWYQKVLGLKTVYPLNLVSYVKKDAENELKNKFNWQPFKHKHHETRFTRFYEDYWLPRRFGFDKRKAHFSSLIMTNQMGRDEALKRISSSEMDENFLKQEFEYVAHKLDLSIDELQGFFEIPKKYYYQYKNKRWIINLGARALRILGLERRYFR